MIEETEFDYVVLGAGSAGCVVASRLAERAPEARILLIEAGGWDWHPFVRVPLGVGRIWGFDRFDWGYRAHSGPATGDREIEAVRGKIVGGSHSINAMGYIRGNRVDYDRWASYGLPGWSFAEVLPYFKRAETWEDGENELRGGSGPLYVRRTKTIDPMYEAYIAAGVGAGHPFTDDYNGARQHGFAWAQWTIRDGLRDTTARAYLRPALKKRGALQVATHALASRVAIHRGRAIGIEYESHGRKRLAKAVAEVVLCAGAINTPQVLMLSGVGDAERLRRVGVDAVHELKGVGANLQDHYSTALMHERKEPGPFVAQSRADRLAFNFVRAYATGKGPATDVPSGFMAFVKTDPSLEAPDIQFLMRSGPSNAGPWFPGWRSPWTDAFVCRPVLLRPKSRGRVSLRSSDPHAPPLIEQNFLAESDDAKILRQGLRLLRDVAARRELDSFRGRELAPGSDVVGDGELDAYLRSRPATAHHPCGTCRMGMDDEAVVDSELRVRGLSGLRVADASVMPDLVGGNINAAVIMIAERAADLIRPDAARASRPAL